MSKSQVRETATLVAIGVAQIGIFWRSFPELVLPLVLSQFLTMVALAYAMWLSRYWRRDPNPTRK